MLLAWDSWSTDAFTAEFGRRLLPVAAHDQLQEAPERRVPSSLFETRHAECSLEQTAVDSVLSSQPTFPSLSSSATKMAAIRLMNLVKYKGDWKRMSASWLSLLLPRHALCYQMSSKHGYVVLEPCQWGALALAVSLKKCKSESTVALMDRKLSDVKLLVIENPADWKACPLECLAPSSPRWKTAAASSTSDVHIRRMTVLPVQGKARPLMEVAVQLGLQNFTVPLLKKLWSYLRAQQPAASSASSTEPLATGGAQQPKTTELLMEAIYGMVFKKTCSAENLASVLANREARPGDDIMKECVVQNPGLELLFEAGEDDKDEDDEMRAYGDALLQYRTRLETVKTQVARSTEPSQSMPTPAAASAANRKLQVVQWLPDRAKTFQEGAALFPPGARPSLENNRWHTRWKCSAGYCSQMHSRCFTEGSKVTQDEALRHVLRLVWASYTRAHGTPCPYDLDTPLS